MLGSSPYNIKDIQRRINQGQSIQEICLDLKRSGTKIAPDTIYKMLREHHILPPRARKQAGLPLAKKLKKDKFDTGP